MLKHLFLQICLLLLATINSIGQCPPDFKCPREGRKRDCSPITSIKDRNLNIAKNKSSAIPDRWADYWAIDELIDLPDEEDKDLYNSGDFMYTEGYIISFIEEGPESCNCYQASKAKKTGDVHIYIGLRPDAPKSECVIVEITPEYKLLNPGYEDQLVKNARVRVFGYLLYDHQHRANATMTCSSCTQIWRKTNWELHPIVYMEEI